MIGNLLPSIFPTISQTSLDPVPADPGEGAGRNHRHSRPDAIGGGLSAVSDDFRPERAGRHAGSDPAARDFAHTAKHMIRHALKGFAHDLKASLHDLGFKSDMVMRLAHEVMQGAKEALRSGADFTANLMVAAMTQTTATGGADAASSFNLVASEFEVTINHTTGSIEVSATRVAIEGQLAAGDGANATPQLVDFQDTDVPQATTLAERLLALSDLDAALDDSAPEATALAPQLAALPESTPASASGTGDATVPVAASAEEAGTEPAPETDPPIDIPESTGVSRIIVTAFEHYLDAAGERFTYLRFDAIVPLGLPPEGEPAPAPAPVEQIVPLPEGQPVVPEKMDLVA